MLYHNGRDHRSHVFKHSIAKSHKNVNTIDFKIIDNSFNNNKLINKNGKLSKRYGSMIYDQC